MRTARLLIASMVLALVGAALAPAALADGPAGPPTDVRFATFNASLNRNLDGQLMSDLSVPGNAQADAVAEIIQRVNPDVLLLNEFDYDENGVALQGFLDNYLAVPHGDAAPITDYDYTFIAESNTGIHSGHDLNRDGIIDTVPGPFDFNYANDAFGFGWFPGQFGMAVLSRYPIDDAAIRTFQTFLWRDMPGALLPDDLATPEPADWYSPEELDVFRLSSKSHWDLPIDIDGRTVHFLVSHPTPPVFDDPVSDYNGRRNHDEIRFWADYIDPARSGYIYDDNGNHGGLHGRDRFVIAGDQNSDPLDGDSIPGSIQQLLDHPEGQRQGHTVIGGWSRTGRPAGREQRRPPQRSGLRHRRLQRGVVRWARQPESRLRAAPQDHADNRRRGVLAAHLGPALRARGPRVPRRQFGSPSGLDRRRRQLRKRTRREPIRSRSGSLRRERNDRIRPR